MTVRLTWEEQQLTGRDGSEKQFEAHLQGGQLTITERCEFGCFGGAIWHPPKNWPFMSGRHFAIEPTEDGGGILHDPGSTNGTFINSVRVSPRGTAGSKPLAHGDVIEAGGIVFQVHITSDNPTVVDINSLTE